MGDESGEEEPQKEEKKFCVDVAKTGRAVCKKCKEKIDQGTLRLAKKGYNPFGKGLMKMWHHVPCMFEVFSRQRATTARIDFPDDMDGWSSLDEEDQEEILKYLGPGLKKAAKTATKSPKQATDSAKKEQSKTDECAKLHKDNSFREFRRLCAAVAETDSYTGKTAHVKEFFTKGCDKASFHGDLQLWCRLLLPGAVKRVYNLQSKQLIKLFSRIFHTDQDDMLEHLEQGDVAETITVFFEKSTHLEPARKSTLTLQDVDNFLEKLSTMTKEEEQTNHFKNIAKKCTSNDLKMLIRLVKHDLRINAGPKHILEAVHPDAYQAFQTSRDLDAVISRVLTKPGPETSGSPIKKGALKISVSLMTPVLPMLAEACKSVEYAMKKCPNGMYSEIKYDGERVQVHKKGDEFKYFSRSLKPVMRHKIQTFEEYIPQAFPHGKDLILDSEVLMVDVNTGKPLPFGTLGVHKKTAFKDANVCLFVFDCIYYNGEVLLNRPIKERRKILRENMKEITNHIMFSEMEEVHDPKDLENMITKVLRLGLEGLVLKDLMGTYEPGKRHWLKVKKDYLFGGAMADSADLVVLGAWFGTGQKGGMMSVFLMGCYDPAAKKWRTVTKVHTGHDDKTLERLQDELDMIKISKEASRVPDWLSCTKTMIPDFVARDPKKMPVWEISGAEFTQHDVHTADGISIRFPRVTRIRDDKDWQTATTLPELKVLFKKSKDSENFTLFSSSTDKDDSGKPSTSTKRKTVTPKKEVMDEKRSPSPELKNKSENSCSTTDANNSDEETTPKKKKKKKDEDVVPKDSRASDEEEEKEKRTSDSEAGPAPKKYKTSVVGKPRKPLPDVFQGVKLILPDKIQEDRSELKRYFVAYGGELLDQDHKKQSTHVLHLGATANTDMSGWPREARHVTSSWLWNSIKNQRLEDPRHYTVYVKSL